jgi:hypothetical protein
MDLAQEFRKHASECQAMARHSSDPQSRATWKQMAERWLRCANWAGDEEVAAQTAAAARVRARKSRRGSDHHQHVSL